MKMISTSKNVLSKKSLIHFSKMRITSAEIRSQIEISSKTHYNKFTQPEEYNKEFKNQHKNGQIYHWLLKWFSQPFKMGWFNTGRDTDTGNARYNCGGAYPNKISSIIYRTKCLQSPFLMNFAMRFLDRRNTIERARYENQPGITTNSVFLYKNSSNYLLNRRGLERLLLIFFLAQGLNFSGVILYLGIASYFCLLVSIYK